MASVALAEERPGHVVLRASKVVATSDWMGREYEPKFASSAGDGELPGRGWRWTSWPSTTPPPSAAGSPHDTMLREVVQREGGAWGPYGTFDVVRDGVLFPKALRLYRQRIDPSRPRRELTFADLVGREIPWR